MIPLLAFYLYLAELESVADGFMKLFAVAPENAEPYAWKAKILPFPTDTEMVENLTLALTLLQKEKSKKFLLDVP